MTPEEQYEKETGKTLYDQDGEIEYKEYIQWLRQKAEEGRVAIEKLNECHDWYCGCGHWNGANLATCAMCGQTPNESLP